MRKHFVAPDQQGNGHRQSKNEFQRRPKHAHELHETQAAADILLIRLSKAAICASSWANARTSRAPEKFSCACAEISEYIA